MRLQGCFMIVGPDMSAPEVHALAAGERAAFDDGLRVALKHGERARLAVYRQTFRAPASYAFDCASPALLAWLVEHYDGPHREAVRGLAACIATGTPYGPDPDAPGGEGGDREPLQPAPRGPAPADAIPAALMF